MWHAHIKDVAPWTTYPRDHRNDALQLHRENGPAIENTVTRKYSWWVDGKPAGRCKDGINPFLDALWKKVPLNRDIIVKAGEAYPAGRSETSTKIWLELVLDAFPDPNAIIELVEQTHARREDNMWDLQYLLENWRSLHQQPARKM